MKTIIFAFLIIFASSLFADDFVIVVNKGSSLTSASTAELKRIFTGKSSLVEGVDVKPANLALDNPAAIAFLKQILKMTPAEYKSFWLAEQVRGGGSAPAVQKTTDAMITYVSQNTNAIGYLPAGSVNENVKIIVLK